ncbi:hypothetical protein [Aggregatibacter actinomycetemcomitans]|uniref:hypothetical protein n=1 Tax=Aggregatibacter actinomycetemcomitans TaxID=714 RepID=UPI0030D26631
MKIFVVLMAFLTGGCFLLVKPTKDFPDLKIAYLSTGYYITKNYKGNEHRVPSLKISSNIDIEDEALKQGLAITNKDLLCVFNKKLLKNSDMPNSYRTIGGGVTDEDKSKKNDYWNYKFTIRSTKNKHFHDYPIGTPENIIDKKENDILYCQYVIYFYFADSVVKSNIIEIPFKDFKGIKPILLKIK